MYSSVTSKASIFFESNSPACCSRSERNLSKFPAGILTVQTASMEEAPAVCVSVP